MKTAALLLTLMLITAANAQQYRARWSEGVEAYKNKDFATAEEKFNQALEGGAGAHPNWLNLGNALYRQGRTDDALNAFEKAYGGTSNKVLQSKALQNMGNVYWDKKENQKAKAAYQNALKLDPSNENARYNLAQLLRQLKQEEKSQQDKNQDQKNQDQKNQDQDKNQSDPKPENNKPENSKENQPGNPKEDDADKQPQKPDEKQGNLPRELAEQLLNALQKEEQKVQDKMKKAQVKVPATPTEKDW